MTMRAMLMPSFGGPDVFECREVPMPRCAPDQMRVRVHACGVCGHDLLNRAGHFPHTRLPAVMGHEIAGTVEEAGPLVTRFAPGDRVAMIQRMPCGVCALCRSGRENLCTSGPGFYGEDVSGGYGSHVLATERNAVKLPDSIPLEIACTLSCAIGTGFHALRRAQLTLGDSVVITGASGGVGIHTVKLARLLGLRAIAISSSPDKVERLRAAGAAEVVVAPDFQFHKEVKELTGGLGADAIIEIAGRPTFASSTRALRAAGRMVIVGNVDPGSVALNPAMAILREMDFVGSAHATVADLQKVIALVERGEIAPEIAGVLPVEDAAEAHRRMEARGTSGRMVLLHGGGG
ncbi:MULTISPECIES: alcohol dehydrogenase catalytic domain-containing protein [unclassified Chelatococcus]|uniref:alcohol dehydrogenase catalytic domain-containing protein n=1 Tax=unclassified Chelatococcus TaxID=2638111 RepID=UPI001BCA6B9F|nr:MULTISPECIES: alcohol dehydrogenase catalytic domain-containing protein [unclassified Chelatococcus]MBS7742672.1 alcohol dehydrogenase catalytic domain-containing protein [Chelatococcus sp. HY11]MBX3542210.1 alcohol dehydrogenase catalytic domain-containing protein [Chelatococcus sp.]MCO5075573.1 alcohol dehydrogenase catalytic domain-containing protein [Chelatococcus sp.]